MFGVARVKGAQGDDYSADDKVVPSPKHYVAYGQPEGGRDYDTTDMSEQRLRNMYVPPFKAAIDAGADTVMCSFNAIIGVPGCANRYMETEVLKKEWGFDGFIESDYTAVAETRACPPVTPNDFKRITLDPGETRTVQFTINCSDVGFYDNAGQFVVEPEKIQLYIGKSSSGGRKTSFTGTR